MLKVIRFEPVRGIQEAGEATLQDFQVHQMTCTQDRVKISGWDKGYIEYSIDVAIPNSLKIVEHIQDPRRQHELSKEGPAPKQLGLSPPEVISLESVDPANKYQLVLTRTEKRGSDGLKHCRKAELLRIDARGNVSQRALLYEHRFTEYGG